MFKMPVKHVKLHVIKTGDGRAMNINLNPPFWTRVVLRHKKANKAIVLLIDQCSKEIHEAGFIVPIFWTVTVDMPVIFGTINIVVRPKVY